MVSRSRSDSSFPRSRTSPRSCASTRCASTSEAGSGHPTSCCSAADVVAALFFAEMRFDPKDPQQSRQRSLRAVEGARRADSVRRVGRGRRVRSRRAAEAAHDRLGPRRPSDAAAAVRRRRHRLARPGHLRGDRHRAERAPDRVRLPHLRAARRRRDRPKDRSGRRPTSPPIDELDNLCGITDVNGLGQSRPTMWQHDMEQFARRWRAFGWHAIVIDGHDMSAILDALAEARAHQGPADDDPGADDQGQGRVVRRRQGRLARQAVQEGRGARPRARRAREAVRARARPARPRAPDSEAAGRAGARAPTPKPVAPPAYKLGDQVATREAYGTALAKLGEADPRVVALDADVKNSTFSDKFEKVLPDRFYQNFIAEQVMVGAAMGLAARGAIPFPSTFACFLDARGRLHPHGGDQQRRHQDGRLARRRVDRRGRPVADGARGSRDVPRAAELHGALSVRRGQHRAARRAGGVPPGPGLHPHEPSEDAGHLRRTTRRSRSAA